MITFRNTVTILHKENGVWHKREYNKASWQQSTSKGQNDNTSVITNTVICRILTKGPILCSVGDYAIKGTIHEEVDNNNVLQVVENHRPDVFKITNYTDNTNKPLSHHRLEG